MKIRVKTMVGIFCLFFMSQTLFGQMIEGKVYRYYVVVGSYNTSELAQSGLKRLEQKNKGVLFILNSPHDKRYRICYAQSKTKSDILTLLEEAKQVFPQAWVLYL